MVRTRRQAAATDTSSLYPNLSAEMRSEVEAESSHEDEEADDDYGPRQDRNISQSAHQRSLSRPPDRRTDRSDGADFPLNSQLDDADWSIRIEYVAFILVAFLIAFIIWQLCPSSQYRTSLPTSSSIGIYQIGLRTMRTQFPNQFNSTYFILRTIGRLAFNSSINDKEPIVLLIAGESTIVRCFATSLLCVLMNSTHQSCSTIGSLLIDGSRLSTKRDIDTRLQLALSNHRLAALFSLEKLQTDTPLVLHKYCDHANAPFADAIILLTYEVDISIDSENDCELQVRDAISNSWSSTGTGQLNDDTIAPILSRMANYVVCIRSELISPCGSK